MPSGPFLQRLIATQKVFRQLDKAKLPNLSNMWPEIQQRLAVYDPGNQYAVNYMWGTTGIGINVKKVREALGDIPLNTWDLVMKPELAAKLKSCGIYMLDAPGGPVPRRPALSRPQPGFEAQATTSRRRATALLKVRGNVQKFHSSEYINALANGDICMAVGYSGDVIQAKKRAEEAKNGVEVAVHHPARRRADVVRLLRHSRRRQERRRGARVHQLHDAARSRRARTPTSSPTRPATSRRRRVDPEILNDPGIYPDEATFKRLFTNTAYDDRSQRIVTRCGRG